MLFRSDSQLHLSIHERPTKLPLVEITGNPRGMVSIANILLWLASPATDYDSLSISALPFLTVDSALGLTVLLIPEDEAENHCQGRLVRLDKAMQFEWQTTEQELIHVALLAHQIGCTPEKGYFDACFSSDSDADMMFELTSEEQ